jgi:two-component system sensor histidine kinase RegB
MNAATMTGFGAAMQAEPGWARGFVQGASLHNLQQLVVMRNIAVAAQALTVLVVSQGLRIGLPLAEMGAVIAALALFNVVTWGRLRSSRPVSELELMLQLLVDVAALTLLLALAGGATNPFIGMFLLPLAITAASLPWTYTWVVALVTLASYTLLVVFFRPLFDAGQEAKYLPLLVSGMWVNYAITAGMIAHFVVQISMGTRRRQLQMAAHRERELCEEHLVRIGTLAAGAAHELARPLASMSIAVSDLQQICRNQPEARALAQIVSDQLEQCRGTLQEMLSYGRDTFGSQTQVQPLHAFVESCVSTLQARRPGVVTSLRAEGVGAPPLIRHDMALGQGLLNLLGNAADVSPQWVEVVLGWDEHEARIEIRDRGPGLAPSVQQQLGRVFFTTKPGGVGNGLGLCLAQTAVLRLGGSLNLTNLPEGGACATVTLPREDTR